MKNYEKYLKVDEMNEMNEMSGEKQVAMEKVIRAIMYSKSVDQLEDAAKMAISFINIYGDTWWATLLGTPKTDGPMMQKFISLVRDQGDIIVRTIKKQH